MKFLGYELTGHLVAASSPATESLSNVKACAANGAAAIILKSASSTRLHDEKTRRCYIDEHGFWAESGFDREIMPLEQALLLTKQSVEQCNIPIIPSVTELTLEPDKWLEDCQTLEKAGASAIQLDFFYFHNLLCDNSFNSKFISLLKEIKRNTMIPIMPKISISIPAELASYLLVSAGIEYVSLLDSIHVPKPYNSYLLGESLSLFGSFMFQITRQYTYVFAKTDIKICAGGGVTSATHVQDLILLGASVVQIATEVLLKGFSRFNQIEKDFATMAPEDMRITSIRKRKAFFYPENCINCGKCREQCFCSVVHELEETNEKCEGCGLCANICKSGAIKMIET